MTYRTFEDDRAMHRARRDRRAPYPGRPQQRRPADSAPGRTARQSRYGGYAVTGRSVAINKPRQEIYAFWRDFSNLSRFMENVESVHEAGEIDTTFMISHRLPLEEAPRGYANLKDNQNDWTKVVLKPGTATV